MKKIISKLSIDKSALRKHLLVLGGTVVGLVVAGILSEKKPENVTINVVNLPAEEPETVVE